MQGTVLGIHALCSDKKKKKAPHTLDCCIDYLMGRSGDHTCQCGRVQRTRLLDENLATLTYSEFKSPFTFASEVSTFVVLACYSFSCYHFVTFNVSGKPILMVMHSLFL